MIEQSQTKDAHGTVLCVLSSEQQEAYRAELGTWQRSGLRFVFQESPEQALDGIADIGPVLVLVGMDVGTMEGLEFVALLFKRYPKFAQRVIVLPDKGDPFSPMLQFRDPKSGRSTTEAIALGAIQALVESLSRQWARAAETPVVPGPETVARTPTEQQPIALQPIHAVSKPREKPVEPATVVEHKAKPAVEPQPTHAVVPKPRKPPSFERQAKADQPRAAAEPRAAPDRPSPAAAREPTPLPQPEKALIGQAAQRVSPVRDLPAVAAGPTPAAAGGVAVESAIEQALAAGQEPATRALPDPSQPLGSLEQTPASESVPPASAPSASPVPSRKTARLRKWWIAAAVAAAAATLTIVMAITSGSEQAPTPGPSGAASRPVTKPSPPPIPPQAAAAFAAQPPGEKPAAQPRETTEDSSQRPAVDLSRRTTLPIRFPKGSGEYTIADPEALKAIIAAAAQALSEKRSRRLEVDGHASQEGSEVFNINVGSVRANNVGRYLISQGIPADRVVLRSHGSSIPLAPGANTAPESNRRVTVRILQ